MSPAWKKWALLDARNYFVFFLLFFLLSLNSVRAEPLGVLAMVTNGGGSLSEAAESPVKKVVTQAASLPETESANPSSTKDTTPQPLTEKSKSILNDRLMEATRRGKLNEVRALLKQGADPNHEETSGATPAYLAVKTGWVELAEILYAGGAKFTHRSANGTSFLHMAAAAGQVRMAEYLISLGCNPSGKTSKDWTPLHHAARFGKSEMVSFLLGKGLNPNVKNSDGFSPLALAKNAHQWHVVRQLTPYASK